MLRSESPLDGVLAVSVIAVKFKKLVGVSLASVCCLGGPIASANADAVLPSLSSMAVTPEAVASYLEGVMDTTRQAARDPSFVGVQMTTCRVAVEGADENAIYLYQEQALSEDLNAPYRQRFLQIVPGDGQRVDSNSFKPETPEQWTGLCDRANRSVSAIALGAQVCTVSLRASVLGGFVGSTPAAGCPVDFRGASSVTNIVVLHEDGMDTWDRGFDAEGNQLWGADNIPYRYRRDGAIE